VRKGEGEIILRYAFIKEASNYVGGKYVILDIVKKIIHIFKLYILNFYKKYGFKELLEIKTQKETLIRLISKIPEN
jgi:hypothetical protein